MRSEPIIIATSPPKGWLTWGKVAKHLDRLKNGSHIEMPGAAVTARDGRLDVWPGQRGEVAPFTVFAGPAAVTITPGFVMAEGHWLAPAPLTVDAAADYIWLHITSSAFIAPALRSGPADDWRWAGTRLEAVEIVGDDTVHTDTPGVITETISGDDRSAVCSTAAETWILLGEIVAGVVSQASSGNLKLVTGTPVPASGSTYHYLPLVG